MWHAWFVDRCSDMFPYVHRWAFLISRTRTNPLAIFSLPVYVLTYSGSYRFTSRSKLPVYVPPLQRPYVVYPPEGPRPPPPEELRERAREIARKRQQSWMYAVGSLGAPVCVAVSREQHGRWILPSHENLYNADDEHTLVVVVVVVDNLTWKWNGPGL